MGTSCPAYDEDAGAADRLRQELRPAVQASIGRGSASRARPDERNLPRAVAPCGARLLLKCLWLHRMPDGAPSTIRRRPRRLQRHHLVVEGTGHRRSRQGRRLSEASCRRNHHRRSVPDRRGAPWLRTPLREITGQRCRSISSGVRLRTKSRRGCAKQRARRSGSVSCCGLARDAYPPPPRPPPPDIAACVAHLQVDRLTLDDPVRTLVREIVPASGHFAVLATSISATAQRPSTAFCACSASGPPAGRGPGTRWQT